MNEDETLPQLELSKNINKKDQDDFQIDYQRVNQKNIFKGNFVEFHDENWFENCKIGCKNAIDSSLSQWHYFSI